MKKLFCLMAALSLMGCFGVAAQQVGYNRPAVRHQTKKPAASVVDYSDNANWYHGCRKSQQRVDVFYVLPTCVSAWADERGVMHYNADVANPKHRKAWLLSCQLGEDIFGSKANFYLPYYRQTTFGAGANKPSCDAIAAADVIRAFDYYIKHINRGRRFVLAGFSQGACLLVDLLKHMDDATYSKLIAAYAVGGSVSSADLKHRHIRPAKSATDRGVIVCFNSAVDMGSRTISNHLFPDNVVCINPVSWTTGSRPAVLKAKNSGVDADRKEFPYGTAVVPAKAGQEVTVRVDAKRHMLLVKGVEPQRYMLPGMEDYFPCGSLHLQELFFYSRMLQQNVLLRSR